MINDMSEKAHDFSKVLTEAHADKWVALSPDYGAVVAFSDDLVELQKTVGNKDVVYIKAPSTRTFFATC